MASPLRSSRPSQQRLGPNAINTGLFPPDPGGCASSPVSLRSSSLPACFALAAGLPESDGLIVSVLLGVAMFAAGLVGGGVWILDRGKELQERHQPAA